MNITHQQKKMTAEQLKAFRDRFYIPVSDDKLDEIPFYRPPENSPELQFLRKQREELGGFLPARHEACEPLTIPVLEAFKSVTHHLGDREISTTMAFGRILSVLLKDKNIGQRVVPIIPDECRTFGLEGLFRQVGFILPLVNYTHQLIMNRSCIIGSARWSNFRRRNKRSRSFLLLDSSFYFL